MATTRFYPMSQAWVVLVVVVHVAVYLFVATGWTSAWVIVPERHLYNTRQQQQQQQPQTSRRLLQQRIHHTNDKGLWLAAQAAEAEEDSASVATTAEALRSSSIDLDSLVEMDCVVFSRTTTTSTDDGNQNNKKPILELGVLEESRLQPICAWTTEEAFDNYIEFVVDEEDRYTVDLKDVTIHALIPADSLSYGSRQVGGGKGPGNPHGEESELLYYIRKEALEGIEVTIKPELEILW